MFIFNFIPGWLFPAIAIISVLVFFITRFLPGLIPYAKLIHYGSIPVFSISLFLMGASWNNDYWQEQLKAEQDKYERAKVEQEALNAKLGEETKAKLDAIKDTAVQLKRQSDNFTQAIKAKDATVQNIINSFDQAAKAKYDALSAADKAKMDKDMQDAINFQKNCPVVPELYINKLNNSAQNPPKDGGKK